jgi:hypothetical protein
VYSALYNSWGTEDKMTSIDQRVANLMQSESSISKVNKLTGSVVKKAACKIKPCKMGVFGGFSSDALLHAPNSLFDNLALVYRSWLVHSTAYFLDCAFMPILKHSLKDPTDTNNYRVIAGKSILLKLF